MNTQLGNFIKIAVIAIVISISLNSFAINAAVAQPLEQCQDGVDNDADGLIGPSQRPRLHRSNR